MLPKSFFLIYLAKVSKIVTMKYNRSLNDKCDIEIVINYKDEDEENDEIDIKYLNRKNNELLQKFYKNLTTNNRIKIYELIEEGKEFELTHFREMLKNMDSIREYKEKNVEKLKEYKKNWCDKNKDETKAWFKEYYEKNKDSIKARQKKWRDDNKDKIKKYNLNNRNKKNGDNEKNEN